MSPLSSVRLLALRHALAEVTAKIADFRAARDRLVGRRTRGLDVRIELLELEAERLRRQLERDPIHEYAKQCAAARRALAVVEAELSVAEAGRQMLQREGRPARRVIRRIARLQKQWHELDRVIARLGRYERLNDQPGRMTG